MTGCLLIERQVRHNSCLLQGLYLILDERWNTRRPLGEILRLAASCGVRLFQYRNKNNSAREVYRKAVALRDLAAEVHAVFIVNDRCDLALAVEADGVHLGQQDLPLELARAIMGPDKIIGVSTHRPHEVQDAAQGGADYLGFGPIFPTSTKSDHEPVVGIDGLKTIRELTALPIFAIGGIRADSLETIHRAGANGVAVASAVLDASDLEQALRQFQQFSWPPAE